MYMIQQQQQQNMMIGPGSGIRGVYSPSGLRPGIDQMSASNPEWRHILMSQSQSAHFQQTQGPMRTTNTHFQHTQSSTQSMSFLYTF